MTDEKKTSGRKTPPATDAERYPEREETARKRAPRRRRPLVGAQQKMARPQRDGFHRHWVNDEDGRPEMFMEAGYEFVPAMGDDGDNTSGNEEITVGVKPDGSPLKAYLMEQPDEFRQEDLALSRQPVREFEKALEGGIVEGADEKDKDSFYAKDIQVSTKAGVTVNTG